MILFWAEGTGWYCNSLVCTCSSAESGRLGDSLWTGSDCENAESAGGMGSPSCLLLSLPLIVKMFALAA